MVFPGRLYKLNGDELYEKLIRYSEKDWNSMEDTLGIDLGFLRFLGFSIFVFLL